MHPKRLTTAQADHVERAANRTEHAQRQDIDLEQTERVQIVLVPFDHAAIGHRGIFNRHQTAKTITRDHKATGVLRQMARKAHQCIGHRDPMLHQQ